MSHMPKSIGFYSWLLSQVGRNGPVGDLASDVKRDREAPNDNARKEIWLSHLEHKHACSEAIEALNDAWTEFNAK